MSDMVKRVAARHLYAMSYDRKTYQSKIENQCAGAIVEFYKVRLATRLGKIKWVKHWNSEWQRIIRRELPTTLAHSIRGFKDRIKVINGAIQEVRAIDKTYRTRARTEIKTDFRISKLVVDITDQDTEDFYHEVSMMVQEVLSTL